LECEQAGLRLNDSQAMELAFLIAEQLKSERTARGFEVNATE
jgi:hypothetical protein